MKLDAQFFEEALGNGVWASRAFSGSVNGFSQDTRSVGPDDCFVAIKTNRRDGHTFLGSAEAQGAKVALVSNPQESIDLPQFVCPDTVDGLQTLGRAHRQRFKGPVVGITGSAGKTSTKELLAQLLGEQACATRGNLNNTLGVPLSLLRLCEDNTHGVFEAGIDRPGEMDVLAGMILPDIGIVTLIAEAHLELLGSLNGVACEKVKLLKALSRDGLAVFPDACLNYEAFQSLDCTSWVVTRDADLNLESVRQTRVLYWTETTTMRDGGVRLCISGPLRSLSKFDLPEMSQGMIENTVLAILVAQKLDVSEDQIQERISEWKAAKQRGEWVDCAGRRVYVDCYNANPASMLDSVEFFNAATRESESRTFIIGTMNELGDHSVELHREVASKLPIRKADSVFCVGELADDMCHGILDINNDFKNVRGFARVEDLLDVWPSVSGEVFLKGSRGVGLEILLDQPFGGKESAC